MIETTISTRSGRGQNGTLVNDHSLNEDSLAHTIPLEPDNAPRGLSRRTLVKGAAWSVPVVVLATATPAAATSIGPGVIVIEDSYWIPAGERMGVLYGRVDPEAYPDLDLSYFSYSTTAVRSSSVNYYGSGSQFSLYVTTDDAVGPNSFTVTVAIPGYPTVQKRMAADGALGTLAVTEKYWDPSMNYGAVSVQLSPAPGPDLDTGQLVYDDLTMVTGGYEYTSLDRDTLTFNFSSSSPAPDTFTVTITLTGYEPLDVNVLTV
ncbi:hypothetical protein BJQ94_03050 [Cryobacterium sp. SO2]|uniref:hypothetical protein n=1 Tax=Cryobacterium sp. SO2 TaxID=1897060 RepID=UPI0023DC5C65|nr:hypothetical protein [Cryobacterium sp. SO2]WEO78030.1 hypothetical protein BJQ94_03050 [Cryobacterium sp. SO2]